MITSSRHSFSFLYFANLKAEFASFISTISPSLRQIFVASLLCGLAACGGGGGGSGNDHKNQTLAFANTGPVSLWVGDTFTNAANGPGSGTVSYRSSNTSVVTVDNSGVATVVGFGSATITATKTADARYSAASVNYTINSAPKTVAFTAWIGGADTQVNFPSTVNGLSFYRSSTAQCNLGNYASCPNGQLDILTGTPISDSAATLYQDGYYVLKHGSHQAALTVSTTYFSVRLNHALVAFNNQLWLIGGTDGSGPGGVKNDVWSSGDGNTWTRQTAAAAFPARSGHQVVVYNNQLWLIGGSDGNFKNDVWSSNDGITWTQQTAAAAFSPREQHQVVVHNGQLWLIGGSTDAGFANDVWSSSDGINWTQRTAAAAFSSRAYHQVVVFDNQMWLIGGLDGTNTSTNDIWSSSDGVIWTQQSALASFSARHAHQVKVYNNQLWLIGGYNYGSGWMSDIWSSNDGITWTRQSYATAFSPRGGHQVTVYNNQLWLVGGNDGGVKNDVWLSRNGINWIQQGATTLTLSARSGHQMVVYNNQLWLIGGYDNNGDKSDVWSSSDGITWTQQTAAAAFSARGNHQVVVFNNRLWLVGGFDENGSKNDVWSSSDGINWIQETAAAAFSARFGHQVAVYNNQLWVIGGLDGSGGFPGVINDVWSSSDGINWTQRTAAAAFSARLGHQVVVYNNQLWLIGGSENNGSINSYKNDVWSSSDGIHWAQQNVAAAFSPRSSHRVVVFNNRMWLIMGAEYSSGGATNYLSDVWSSGDGINWTQQPAPAFPGRANHQVVAYNNQLLLTGGHASAYQHDVWSSVDGIVWRMGFHGTFLFP